MANPNELITQGVKALTGKSPTPRLDSEVLLASVLKCPDRSGIYTSIPTPYQKRRYLTLLARRARLEPVAYLTRKTWFYGLPIYVNEKVLIPRPESEVIVNEIADRTQHLKRPNIVDVGTGSGCIALALKSILPHTTVTGLDISREALSVAKKNAKTLGLKVNFRQSDLLENYPKPIDILAANLPYLENREYKDALTYEPRLALVSKSNTLYKRLLEYKNYRTGIFEMHDLQAKELALLARQAGLTDIEVLKGYGVSFLVVSRRS